MEVGGKAVYIPIYSYPVYLHSNLPLTIYLFIMDACPVISLKVQKGLKLNLVYTLMLIRGNAEDKNHNHILYFI